LRAIAWTTLDIKYKILMYDNPNDNVNIFKSITWGYGLCIVMFKYLRLVITIDTGFLSSRYKGRLLMSCGYNVENKLFSLAFRIMNEENLDN
jgi:hypothetical protein